MTVRQVVLQSNQSSPLRISAAGFDAQNAQFDELIFDGSQEPLRLWQATYVLAPGIDFMNTANIFATVGMPVMATPVATTPLFVCLGYQELFGGAGGRTDSAPFRNNISGGSQQGLGGSISNVDGAGNRIVGINMWRNNSVGTELSAPAIINFLIFKNIQ
jgi:hypothetical protein